MSSADKLCKKMGWSMRATYLWVDYICVPQRSRATQTLAINSLPTYAYMASAFVTVAPTLEHADTCAATFLIRQVDHTPRPPNALFGRCVRCDVESYKRRAWCRVEQLSCFLQAHQHVLATRHAHTAS